MGTFDWHCQRIVKACSLIILCFFTVSVPVETTAAHVSKPHTVRIGGLFPLRSSTSSTGHDESGKQRWAAFRMAVDEINQNPGLLPLHNITIQTEDTQRKPAHAAVGANALAKDGTGPAWEPAIAVVGAASSTPSTIANYVLQNYDVPQISYSSTSPALSDKVSFPTFLRTVPPDNKQGEAMIGVALHFRWRSVGLLTTSDTYGQGGGSAVLEASRQRGVTVLEHTTLASGASDGALVRTMTSMIRSKAKIILFFGDTSTYSRVLVASSTALTLKRLPQDSLTFVTSDAIAQDSNIADIENTPQALSLADGHIGIRPRVGAGPVWESFLDRWSQRPPESIPFGFTSFASKDINVYAPYAYDAVYAIAYALHRNVSARGMDLVYEIARVNFTGVTGPVAFDAHFDRIGSAFDVVNLRGRSWVSVGEWDSISSYRPVASIVWPSNTNVAPVDTSCDPGSYLDAFEKCQLCPAGFISQAPNVDRCTPCPPGHSTNGKTGSIGCAPCEKGSYQDAQGQSFCIPCAVDQFGPSEGATHCAACPIGTRGTARGSPNVQQCQCSAGFFSISKRPGLPCTRCPQHAICLGGDSAPFAALNYWGDGSMLQDETIEDEDEHRSECPAFVRAEPGSLCMKRHMRLFFECDNTEQCAGQCTSDNTPVSSTGMIGSMEQAAEYGACRSNLTNICSEHHNGRMCALCSEGHFRVSGKCSECPGTEARRWALTIGGAVLVVVVWWAVNAVIADGVAACDMVLLSLQIMAIIGSFKLRWGEPLAGLLGFLSIVNFDVDFLTPGCVGLEWDFAQSFGVQMALPFVVMTAYALLIAATYLRRYLPVTSKLYITESAFVLYRRLSVRNYLSFLNVAYAGLCIKSFQALQCTRLHDGTWFLTASPPITCFSDGHDAILGVGICGILLYAIGIPVSYFCIVLFGVRKDLLADESFYTQFDFLYRRFEPGFTNWNSVIMSRRFVFCVILVFFHDHPLIQACLAVMACSIYIGMHFFARPFIDTDVDYIEAMGVYINMMLVVSGILFYSVEPLDFSPAKVRVGSVSILVILALCATVAAVFIGRAVWGNMLKAAAKRTIRSALASASIGGVHRLASESTIASDLELLNTLNPKITRNFTQQFQFRTGSMQNIQNKHTLTPDVRQLQELRQFVHLNDSMRAHISDDAEVSVFSRSITAKMYRRLGQACSFLIDGLVACSSEDRQLFHRAFHLIQLIYEAGVEHGGFPISESITEEDIPAVLHWITTAHDDDLQLFQDSISAVFRPSGIVPLNRSMLRNRLQAATCRKSSVTGDNDSDREGLTPSSHVELTALHVRIQDPPTMNTKSHLTNDNSHRSVGKSVEFYSYPRPSSDADLTCLRLNVETPTGFPPSFPTAGTYIPQNGTLATSSNALPVAETPKLGQPKYGSDNINGDHDVSDVGDVAGAVAPSGLVSYGPVDYGARESMQGESNGTLDRSMEAHKGHDHSCIADNGNGNGNGNALLVPLNVNNFSPAVHDFSPQIETIIPTMDAHGSVGEVSLVSGLPQEPPLLNQMTGTTAIDNTSNTHSSDITVAVVDVPQALSKPPSGGHYSH